MMRASDMKQVRRRLKCSANRNAEIWRRMYSAMNIVLAQAQNAEIGLKKWRVTLANDGADKLFEWADKKLAYDYMEANPGSRIEEAGPIDWDRQDHSKRAEDDRAREKYLKNSAEWAKKAGELMEWYKAGYETIGQMLFTLDKVLKATKNRGR